MKEKGKRDYYFSRYCNCGAVARCHYCYANTHHHHHHRVCMLYICRYNRIDHVSERGCQTHQDVWRYDHPQCSAQGQRSLALSLSLSLSHHLGVLILTPLRNFPRNVSSLSHCFSLHCSKNPLLVFYNIILSLTRILNLHDCTMAHLSWLHPSTCYSNWFDHLITFELTIVSSLLTLICCSV